MDKKKKELASIRDDVRRSITGWLVGNLNKNIDKIHEFLDKYDPDGDGEDEILGVAAELGSAAEDLVSAVEYLEDTLFSVDDAVE